MFRRSKRGAPNGDGVREDLVGRVDGVGGDGLAGVDGADSVEEWDSEEVLVTRRSALIGGAAVVGGLMVGEVGVLTFGVAAAAAALPTTTAPEQLRLEWGADPATEVTVSWSAPGTVPMPAPHACLLGVVDHG